MLALQLASTGNAIAIEHSHLVMRVLTGGSPSAHPKFAHECDIACGQYCSASIFSI